MNLTWISLSNPGPRKTRSQYHGCWCLGSLHRQVIIRTSLSFRLMEPLAISVLTNYSKCKYWCLVQERCNSITNALELRLSRTNPSVYFHNSWNKFIMSWQGLSSVAPGTYSTPGGKQETHSSERSGPIFCLLLGISSGCARPIKEPVTSVTWPVIGWAQSELSPSKRRKNGPDLFFYQNWCHSCEKEK